MKITSFKNEKALFELGFMAVHSRRYSKGEPYFLLLVLWCLYTSANLQGVNNEAHHRSCLHI